MEEPVVFVVILDGIIHGAYRSTESAMARAMELLEDENMPIKHRDIAQPSWLIASVYLED